MAFLRKRSGSQCSFSEGDDEISVRRIEQTDVTRKSRSDTIQSMRSSCSSIEASDFALHDSCVFRNFPVHKSSHLRFLAWVAYTRKYTDGYITEDERRTCPLLWCRDVFETQEAMLEHVWNCPCLSKGLYWCFHCQKPERVAKFNCKRCQGAPSRTDRMTSVAKKIFSKLGARAHRTDHSTLPSSSETSKSLSKEFGDSDPSVPPYFQDPFSQDQGWSHSGVQELPNSIVIPEMAGDFSAASHELPDTFISEMTGTECPVELSGGSIELREDNFYAENLEDWDIPSVPSPKGRGSSPKLEIDTSVSHTSQPTNWIDTLLSATIISPMSALGKFDSSSDASPVEISPTDTVVSGKSFFSDSGYSSATTQSAIFSSRSFDRFPSISGRKLKKREFGAVSEAWIKDSASSIPQSISSLVTMTVATPNIEAPAKVAHSAGRCTDSSKQTFVSSHWNDTLSLVQSFSGSLDAHIQHTKSTLKMLPQTSTTLELMSMSKTSIVSIGLEVLTGILEGRNPSAIVQIFAFTHVACALAIAADDDEAKIHSQQWFQDTLQWSTSLRGEKQQRGYEKVARAIWQPLETLADSTPLDASSPENTLFATCKHFLDIFESLDSSKAVGPTPFQQFNFAQASFEHKAKTIVIDELIKKPRIEAFIEDVVKVERGLYLGQITNTRDLELELIRAAKRASQSGTAYGRFLSHVAILCDVLYTEEPSKLSRTGYHVRNISRIRELMPDEHYDEAAGRTDFGPEGEQTTDFLNLGDEHEDLLLLDLGFESTSEQTSFRKDLVDKHHDVAVFSRDCDDMLHFTHGNHTSVHVESHQPYHHTPLLASQTQPQHSSISLNDPPSITLHPPTPTPITIASSASAFTSGSSSPANTNTPTTSQSLHRCHCGYIPTGEERWKASNLRRHKRIQHSTDSKVYMCCWQGCRSSFTRSDNLKCHVREKGHYEGAEGSGSGETGDDDEGRKRKRRRVGGGGEGEKGRVGMVLH